MKANLALSIGMALLLSACNNSATPNVDSTTTTQTTPPPEQINTTNPVVENEEVPIPTESGVLKMAYVKDKEGQKKIKYTISEETIDSLNDIVPVYEKTKYNRIAVSYFSALADSFHGRPYFVESSDNLVHSLMDILTTRINDGTDIVFLIDKTGSMDDDIETVKNSLQLMMDYLSKFSNVKVGIASYGDENYHFNLWYNYVNLTRDYDQLRSFMESYSTIGNPDDAESVNDGIVKTIETMHWTPGNRRLLLVIGDAQSQEPPLSRNSTSDVIRKCNAMHVQFNLYPVIISTRATNIITQKVNKEFVKLGPNPANDICTLTFLESGYYNYEINDLSGRTIQSGHVTNSSLDLNLIDVPTGKYLIQIYNNKLSDYFSTPLIVAH